MTTRRAWLVLLLSACACGRKEPPPAPPVSALEAAVRAVSAEGACGTQIPVHWSTSLPVPSMRGGKLHYRVFFFGRDGSPEKGFIFHSPEGEASFTPDGRVLKCGQLPGSAAQIPRDLRFEALTLEEIVARSSRLHADIEAVAAYYAAGRDIGESGRARVAAFARDFAGLANPGHAAAYRALDPDFWAWVEKNGGVAPK